MSIYLDASVLVALLTEDEFAARADVFLHEASGDLYASDFAAAEFASAVARLVRMGETSKSKANELFGIFDEFRQRMLRNVDVLPQDIKMAEHIIRRLDLPLRAPDALHIAIARRAGAQLATLDSRMADCAAALGLAVAPL